MSFHRKLLPLLLVALLAVPCSAQTARTDSGQPYRFSAHDFAGKNSDFVGICITALPPAGQGVLCVEGRILRTGDFLTADQLSQVVFHPRESEADAACAVRYLPVCSDGPHRETTLVLTVHGKENLPPVAEDDAAETYRNLPREGLLKVSDPEDQPLTFTLIRQPRRGEVILRKDGSFLYTPGKNKVGTDSFTFTATDPAGNCSREATVTLRVLKTTTEQPYSDTVGTDCRFSAEWLRTNGIFTGEAVGGQSCFSPEEPVTRGQFLAMLMQTLQLPVERRSEHPASAADAPVWVQPYLAAAQGCGVIRSSEAESDSFHPREPVCAREAASMIRQALCIALPAGTAGDSSLAVWAQDIICSLSPAGNPMAPDQVLNRSDVSRILYEIHRFQQASLPIFQFFPE